MAVIKAIRRSRKAARQEERLAILLDEMIKYPKLRRKILRAYPKDNAKTIMTILRMFKRAIGARNANPPEVTLFGNRPARALNGLELVKIAWRGFNMPALRVNFFYFTAKHLGKYPEINEFLWHKLVRSRSIFLEPYRREIADLLHRSVGLDEKN